MSDDLTVIYLQPECGCEVDPCYGRMWCPEPDGLYCDECGAAPERYVHNGSADDEVTG